MGQQQSLAEEGSQPDDWWTRDPPAPAVHASSSGKSHSLPPNSQSKFYVPEPLAVFNEPPAHGMTTSLMPMHSQLPTIPQERMPNTRRKHTEPHNAVGMKFDSLPTSPPSHSPMSRAEFSAVYSVQDDRAVVRHTRPEQTRRPTSTSSLPPSLHSSSPSVVKEARAPLRRGRKVIRRGRSEDHDGIMPDVTVTHLNRRPSRRTTSVRSRLHYDLVLDKTSTIKRGRAVGKGKLTLITTRKGLQNEFGRPRLLSECASNVDDIIVEDVTQRVSAYNDQSGRELIWMTVDGTALEGYIDVQLELSNPIHVLQLEGGNGSQGLLRRASLQAMYFANCHRTLLISSNTSVAELIEQLIAAYQVVDQPSCFALHECRKGKRFVGRALDDEERPLLLSLLWGAQTDRSLELREVKTSASPGKLIERPPLYAPDINNDSDSGIALGSSKNSTVRIDVEDVDSANGVESPTMMSRVSLPHVGLSPEPAKPAAHGSSGTTINWADFTLPELSNFLRMLAAEEERQLKVLETRYERNRNKILTRMHDMAAKGEGDGLPVGVYGTLV